MTTVIAVLCLALFCWLSWLCWSRWRTMRRRQILKRWECHLVACRRCRWALRGRFAGASMASMASRCCERGRRLYGAFIKSVT
jgi:hypothetical protein